MDTTSPLSVEPCRVAVSSSNNHPAPAALTAAPSQHTGRPAAESQLMNCLSSLRRWAHGRVPPAARGRFDTCDFVQEAAIRTLARLDVFEPRHPAALEAYMRRAILNLVRDEARRIARRPVSTEVPEDLPSPLPKPLDTVIQNEADECHRRALGRLSLKDRRLILSRVYYARSAAEIAKEFDLPSSDAARMAVGRALTRLKQQIANSSAAEAPSSAKGSIGQARLALGANRSDRS